MAPRDIFILMLCCACWAGNFTLIAWAANDNNVPPLLLAAVRALIVVAIMSPFLFKPRPQLFRRMLLVAFFVGPMHLAFLYTGLTTASASGGAIVSQMLIPMSTLLAILFLKERIGLIRSTAIVGAFAGTLVMLWQPGALAFDTGLLIILVAYFWIAVGSVMMRTLGDLDWRIYVAWTAVMVAVIMVTASLVFEGDPRPALTTQTLPLFVSAIYAALAVSIVAHGQYFRLLTRYEVNDVIPLTLMVPVFTVLIAFIAFQTLPSQQALLGAALILPCVYVIAKRGGKNATKSILREAPNEFD